MQIPLKLMKAGIVVLLIVELTLNPVRRPPETDLTTIFTINHDLFFHRKTDFQSHAFTISQILHSAYII